MLTPHGRAYFSPFLLFVEEVRPLQKSFYTQLPQMIISKLSLWYLCLSRVLQKPIGVLGGLHYFVCCLVASLLKWQL